MCLYMVGCWRLAETKWFSREGCAFKLVFRGVIPFSTASHFPSSEAQSPSDLPGAAVRQGGSYRDHL